MEIPLLYQANPITQPVSSARNVKHRLLGSFTPLMIKGNAISSEHKVCLPLRINRAFCFVSQGHT